MLLVDGVVGRSNKELLFGLVMIDSEVILKIFTIEGLSSKYLVILWELTYGRFKIDTVMTKKNLAWCNYLDFLAFVLPLRKGFRRCLVLLFLATHTRNEVYRQPELLLSTLETFI